MQHNSSFWGSNEDCLIQVLIKPDKSSLKLAMGLFTGAISLLVQHCLDSSPSPHVLSSFTYYSNNKQQKYWFLSITKCQMFLVFFGLLSAISSSCFYLLFFNVWNIEEEKMTFFFYKQIDPILQNMCIPWVGSCSTSCSYPIIHLTQTKPICWWRVGRMLQLRCT